jgi:hypothetical protein
MPGIPESTQNSLALRLLELTQVTGIGREIAGQPLCTTGDSPVRSGAAFAMLCRVAPADDDRGCSERSALTPHEPVTGPGWSRQLHFSCGVTM